MSYIDLVITKGRDLINVLIKVSMDLLLSQLCRLHLPENNEEDKGIDIIQLSHSQRMLLMSYRTRFLQVIENHILIAPRFTQFEMNGRDGQFGIKFCGLMMKIYRGLISISIILH